MRRLLLISCLVLLAVTNMFADKPNFVWHNPWNEDFIVVNGLAFPEECRGTYQRIGQVHKDEIPDYVWENSYYSAGLTIRFHSNSPSITIRYKCASDQFGMNHMPATGTSGLDLYARDSQGHEMLCMASYHFGETCSYTYEGLVYKDPARDGYDYEVFLPMYNLVTWMEIGVPEGYDFHFLEAEKEKPIMVYGTSIAHGGCSSRPALGWTNIVKRTLNMPLINWGFSGSGRLDASVFELMAKVDASLYIIDCMPNMVYASEEVIIDKLVKGVHILRAAGNAPILVVEHDGCVCDETNDGERASYERVNAACLKGFRQLQEEGVKELYYLSHDEIDMHPDGQVDGCHSNDIGMMCYAKAYVAKIKSIFYLNH